MATSRGFRTRRTISRIDSESSTTSTLLVFIFHPPDSNDIPGSARPVPRGAREGPLEGPARQGVRLGTGRFGTVGRLMLKQHVNDNPREGGNGPLELLPGFGAPSSRRSFHPKTHPPSPKRVTGPSSDA